MYEKKFHAKAQSKQRRKGKLLCAFAYFAPVRETSCNTATVFSNLPMPSI